MGDLVDGADLIKQPFKDVRGSQHRRDPGDEQQGETKILQRKIYLEQEGQQKTNGELEEDAKKSKQQGVNHSSPENRVGECHLVLGQSVKRHFSADKGLDGR